MRCFLSLQIYTFNCDGQVYLWHIRTVSRWATHTYGITVHRRRTHTLTLTHDAICQQAVSVLWTDRNDAETVSLILMRTARLLECSHTHPRTYITLSYIVTKIEKTIHSNSQDNKANGTLLSGYIHCCRRDMYSRIPIRIHTCTHGVEHAFFDFFSKRFETGNVHRI